MASGQNIHEDVERDEEPIGSSDRSFGLVFAAFFAIIAALRLWHGGSPWPWLGASGAMGVAALAAPGVLAPANRLWFRFGLLLGRVTSPIVMALLFYVVVTPIGLLMRLCGQRPLRLTRSAGQSTYWITRPDAPPWRETLRNQF